MREALARKMRERERDGAPRAAADRPSPGTAWGSKEERLKCLFLCFAAVLLLFGMDCIPEYTTDSYTTFVVPNMWHTMVRSGRLFSGILYFIVGNLIDSPTVIYILSYSTAIVCCTAAIYFYIKEVKSNFSSFYCTVFIAVLLLANAFSVEYFLFIEKGIFCFAIFLTVTAFRYTKRFLESGKKKNLLTAFILLLCVVNFYQTFLALFIVLCLPFIIRYSTNLKTFFFHNGVVALLYGTVMGLAYLMTRFLLHNSRLKGAAPVAEAIPRTMRDIADTFLNGGRVMPGWFFPVTLAIALIFSAWFITKSNKPAGFWTLPYIIVAVTIVAFLPYFLGTTDDIWAVRIKYPFATMIATLLVNLHVNYDFEPKPARLAWRKDAALLAFCAVMFLTQDVAFTAVFVDRYKTNQMDKYLSYLVIRSIVEYQEETGNEVTTICVYGDANRSWSHHGLNHSLLNTRAHVQDWSDVNSISFYAGKKFKRGEPLPEVQNYFWSFDWVLYNEDQLIFDGDTLHWCIY